MTTSLKIFGCSDDEANLASATASDAACSVYRAPEGTPVLKIWASERSTCIDVKSLALALAEAHPQLLRDALAAVAV